MAQNWTSPYEVSECIGNKYSLRKTDRDWSILKSMYNSSRLKSWNERGMFIDHINATGIIDSKTLASHSLCTTHLPLPANHMSLPASPGRQLPFPAIHVRQLSLLVSSKHLSLLASRGGHLSLLASCSKYAALPPDQPQSLHHLASKPPSFISKHKRNSLVPRPTHDLSMLHAEREERVWYVTSRPVTKKIEARKKRFN